MVEKGYTFYKDGAVDLTASSLYRIADPNMKIAPSLKSMESVEVESNSITVAVEYNPTKSVDRFPDIDKDAGFSAQAVTFIGCSSSEQSVTNTAIENAKTMMNQAKSVLDSGSTASYTTWFENTGSIS